MGCCSLLAELRQVSFHLTNSPQAELLLLPGLLASALISLQSILPAVVRRILLEPKSEPLLSPAQNPPWLHLTQSTAQVLTRSCKDLICPLPPLPPCPHVLPLSASPTLLQPHSSLTLPQVFQTHSHLIQSEGRGVNFLTKTGNPEAVKEKRDILDSIKM